MTRTVYRVASNRTSASYPTVYETLDEAHREVEAILAETEHPRATWAAILRENSGPGGVGRLVYYVER